MPPEDLFSSAPEFGDRAACTGLDATSTAPPPLGEAEPPWRPPTPPRPEVEELFEPGARFTTSGKSKYAIEVRDAGVLPLPIGRVAAADSG